MSGHGDPHDEAHSDDDHDHDDHPAPAPPEEPATPLWFTILGIGLFLIAGIVFIATRPDGKTTAEMSAAASADAPSAPSPGATVRGNAPPNPPGTPQPAVRP